LNCRIRTHFFLEDSIEIAHFYKIHGGNGENIIQEMHKKHRLTNYEENNPKHKQKIKDHIKCLLKRSHSTWIDKIPDFKLTARQKQQLSSITDIEDRNIALSRLEREYLGPKEQEQNLRTQLREEDERKNPPGPIFVERNCFSQCLRMLTKGRKSEKMHKSSNSLELRTNNKLIAFQFNRLKPKKI